MEQLTIKMDLKLNEFEIRDRLEFFNSSECKYFRKFLVQYMKKYGYKNGFQIYKSFVFAFPFYYGLSSKEIKNHFRLMLKNLYGGF